MSFPHPAVRLFRLGVVVAAVLLLHWAHDRVDDPAVPFTVDDATAVFPDAKRLGAKLDDLSAYIVHGPNDETLGYVLKTAPDTDDLIGYTGPNDVIVGLDESGAVVRVALLESGDTDAHVRDVVAATDFWRGFEGWRPLAGDGPPVTAVSGSTLTSLAIAESIERRVAGRVRSLRFPDPVLLPEARALFPEAESLHESEGDGWISVRGRDETFLGYLVRSSPASDNIIGYAGPTETLIALEPDRERLRSIVLRRSFDTPEYVERLRTDDVYLEQLAEFPAMSWPDIDYAAAGVEGVSGATLTSFAVAEGIKRRFGGSAAVTDGRPRYRDIALAAILLGSLLLTFGPWRGRRRVRRFWQVILIGGLGIALGDLLSLALLAGWSHNGLPVNSAPALLSLATVALVVPWTTRRQIYCHNLCPHGAAQEWVSSVRRLRRSVAPRLRRTLRLVPGASLCALFLVAALLPSSDLTVVEPFDAWVLGTAALTSLILAVVGLFACFVTPMAYCRFACPTGALLDFVRFRGRKDGFGRRDGVALLLLAVAAAVTWSRPEGTLDGDTGARSVLPSVSGPAFGTRWSVTVRNADDTGLRRPIAEELERIEAELSSWRPRSRVSQFNASSTTLPMEIPEELFDLVALGLELGVATNGDFDITLGPLVDAWGAGPHGPRSNPDAAEIAQLLERVGADKLELDRESRTLRKKHPELQIDLGALLQGYAVDRIAAILDSRGIEEYLIDVGGELRARGSWTVAIEDPSEPGRPRRQLQLTNAALATSGNYRAPRHIIDPRAGRPVKANWLLCSVRASDCVTADGWSTALFAGSATAREIAERQGIAVFAVSAAGEELTVGEGW